VNGIPSTAVRTARPDDLPAVMNILDGASLAVDAAEVRARIEDGTVLVTVADGRVLGACVLDGRKIEAIAVRRKRRGQGIGTKLVETATESTDGDLTAEFHGRVRPFYESLGFAIEPTDESERFRGVR
jgi:GNAT superfamily N-acetyltransferase